MDKKRTKDRGRRKLIRDKAMAQSGKPTRKSTARTMMRRARRHRAIEAAKRHLSEAQQAVTPDREQDSDTAVDKVEAAAGIAAHELIHSLPSVVAGKHDDDNPFHGETDYGENEPDEPTPKERRRRKAERERRQDRRPEAGNAFHGETHYRDTAPPKEQPSAQRTTYTKPTPSQSPSITTGQRQTALPRNRSSVPAPKTQLVKEQGRRLARDKAIQEVKTGATRSAAKAGDSFFKKLGAAVTKAVTPGKETLLYYACALVVFLIPFVVVLGAASMLTGSGEGSGEYVPVSEDVEAYRPLIRLYAEKYDISEYEDLIAAVMMQESGGLGGDPMQCSESGFNTRYSHLPSSITDPEYSVETGVQSLAYVLDLAGAVGPLDMERISLALQGYNYGSGYIFWAKANYGGYSELNAIEYSEMMAQRMGWAGYGDKDYVAHVLRYYPLGRSFMDEGNADDQCGEGRCNLGSAPVYEYGVPGC